MFCDHLRIKKNYPFGRKSKADKYCKDCGDVITNKMIIRNAIKKKRMMR